jgi:hypothetical protein
MYKNFSKSCAQATELTSVFYTQKIKAPPHGSILILFSKWHMPYDFMTHLTKIYFIYLFSIYLTMLSITKIIHGLLIGQLVNELVRTAQEAVVAS